MILPPSPPRRDSSLSVVVDDVVVDGSSTRRLDDACDLANSRQCLVGKNDIGIGAAAMISWPFVALAISSNKKSGHVNKAVTIMKLCAKTMMST
mmetsp:Transcript_26545/g.56086  ORF Transcript_26545/g.56086 Transcript_26545/m.56086 type:complete len:94 (-) Transcript_26545:33-314(-)